jgi:hypothetical protein
LNKERKEAKKEGIFQRKPCFSIEERKGFQSYHLPGLRPHAFDPPRTHKAH